MRFSTRISAVAFLASFALLSPSARAAGAPFGDAPTPKASSDEPRWMMSGSVLVSPLYGKAQAADNHSLEGARAGFGARFEGRYEQLGWVIFALGADYLQGAESNPARHLAFPLRFALFAVRAPAVKVGGGLGAGPAFSWYHSRYAADGLSLRARGLMMEARIEVDVALAENVWLPLSTGARLYIENFTNPDPNSYAEGGFAWPATALDLGLGVGWRF